MGQEVTIIRDGNNNMFHQHVIINETSEVEGIQEGAVIRQSNSNIRANKCAIHGSNNNVSGNGNEVHGSNNNVTGDGNSVYGSNINVTGDNNTANGTNVQMTGKGNKGSGTNVTTNWGVFNTTFNTKPLNKPDNSFLTKVEMDTSKAFKSEQKAAKRQQKDKERAIKRQQKAAKYQTKAKSYSRISVGNGMSGLNNISNVSNVRNSFNYGPSSSAQNGNISINMNCVGGIAYAKNVINGTVIIDDDDKDVTILQKEKEGGTTFPSVLDTIKDSEAEHDSLACVICLDSAKKCRFVSCGHLVYCATCCLKVKEGLTKGDYLQCPLCQIPTETIDIVYI